MNNFFKRTLSAIVYAGLVLSSILLEPACFGGHPLLFGVLMMILSALAVREFHALLDSDIKITTYAMIASVLLFCTLYFLFYGDIVWRTLLLAYVAVLLMAMIVHLFRAEVNPIASWAEAQRNQRKLGKSNNQKAGAEISPAPCSLACI